MKRRDFLKVTGIGAAGAAPLAAPAIAQSMPELKWRLTASWPKSLDTLWGGVEVMAKLVAEATDNKFQLQTFAGGEIVPPFAVLDAVAADVPAVLVLRCPGQSTNGWTIEPAGMTCLRYLAHEGVGWMQPPEQKPCPDRIGVDR